MKKVSSVLWGLVIVAIGVIWGVNALGIADINIFFPGWWTLFIIVPCVIALITEKDKWGSLIGLGIGVCLLLACQDVIEFRVIWALAIPVGLVAIGVGIMIHGMSNSSKAHELAEEHEKRRKEHSHRENLVEGEVIDDDPEYQSAFSGQKINYDKKKFKGCKAEAVFGGIELDLRGADIQKDAVIKATGIFGGVKILLPEDARVEVSSTSIFGGVSNDRKKDDKAKKTLYLDATCIFGGVEVK